VDEWTSPAIAGGMAEIKSGSKPARGPRTVR
jgi:hypothetical protein